MTEGPREGDWIPGGGSEPLYRRRVLVMPVVRLVSFGTMLAIAISYVHNQSIGWAILHGLLSWLYVIYAALFH